jgi:hypothetical protein
VACNKEVEQLLSSSNAEADHSWSFSRCGVISLLGIGAWIVVEYDDECRLKKLRDYLATMCTQVSSAFDWSLIEYLVWINTK